MAGSSEEFTLFFETYERRLRAFSLRRSRDPGLADELVAKVMTIAWRKFDRIPMDSAFGWLCGVALRVAANDDRGHRRRQAIIDRLTAEAETRPLVAYLGDQHLLPEQRQAVVGAFVRLSADDQELLRLVAWDGLDDRELAAVFEISPAAARKRLSRARARFRHLHAGAVLARGAEQ
ncbi:MAG: hypothetical protein QOE93_1369 [Actinomycetota bacterium]|nr:hypothetical protein [Actinomycetota bacterium]